MSRCLSCNVILSYIEEKRKSSVTEEFFNLCDVCLGDIALDIPYSLEGDDPLWDKIADEGDY